MMKDIAKGFAAFIAFMAVIFLIGFLAQGEDFVLYQYFAPKRANVERQVYENTHSYTKGMVQDLYNMEFDYNKTTDTDAKFALGQIYLHRAADFDEDKMPSDLRAFTEKLKAQ